MDGAAYGPFPTAALGASATVLSEGIGRGRLLEQAAVGREGEQATDLHCHSSDVYHAWGASQGPPHIEVWAGDGGVDPALEHGGRVLEDDVDAFGFGEWEPAGGKAMRQPAQAPAGVGPAAADNPRSVYGWLAG